MTVVCIGYRKICGTAELARRVRETLEELIAAGADTFLFGGRSGFGDLCHEAVTALTAKYPHLRRVYVRGECGNGGGEYAARLAGDYEEFLSPKGVQGAGSAAYVKRNRVMIDMCDAAIVYFGDECRLTANGGLARVVAYAKQKGKPVYDLAAPASSDL